MNPLALALLSLVSPAEARDPGCPDLYLEQFQRFLDEVDLEFVGQRYDNARALLDAAHPRVPCILQLVPSTDLAQFAIRRAYSYALDLDENETQRWANLARTIDPQVDWPAYVPVDHVVRQMFAELAPPETVTLPGGLVVPQGGGVFLDGRFLTAPVAETELPHLLQVGDAMGRMVVAEWQDGTVFPDAVLGPPLAEPPEPPRWFTHPNARIRPPKEPRPWTAARLNRLESSAGFALAGGTLFASAWVARLAYEDRATDGLFYTVNGATIASGAAGGAAIVLLGSALFGK